MQNQSIRKCKCGSLTYHTYTQCYECRKKVANKRACKIREEIREEDKLYGSITPASKVSDHSGIKEEMWNINDSAIYC